MPRLAVWNSTADVAEFHDPTWMPLDAGIVYNVMPIVRVKPEAGIGPMTPPSVQHFAHCHVADPVPAPEFHVSSPGSSASTRAGGVARPVKPVLVKLAWSFLGPL